MARYLIPLLGIVLMVAVSGCTSTEEPAGGTGQIVAESPGQADLVLTSLGFSGISIVPGSMLSGEKLYIELQNPLDEPVIIRKVVASYLDRSASNTTDSSPLQPGDSLPYVLELPDVAGSVAWVDVEVTYDVPGTGEKNMKSSGYLIGGMPQERVLECSIASLEIDKYKFYFGTRMLDVKLRNTGKQDLNIGIYFREDGELREVHDPLVLAYGETVTVELEGLTKDMESVLFVSQCPSACQAIFVEDVAGV